MPSEDHTSAVARALDVLAKPREAFVTPRVASRGFIAGR